MSKTSTRFSNNIQIKNRKAKFEFELLETLEVGIQLRGSEIKSIREGKASLQESYCFISNGEVFIKNMNITEYSNVSFNAPERNRERKLLLKKREIERLKAKTEEKGLTLVATKLYITKRGFAKLEIALGRGKKLFDKRENIKQKDQKRELERIRI